MPLCYYRGHFSIYYYALANLYDAESILIFALVLKKMAALMLPEKRGAIKLTDDLIKKATCRNRTGDLLITNQLLYQLS